MFMCLKREWAMGCGKVAWSALKYVIQRSELSGTLSTMRGGIWHLRAHQSYKAGMYIHVVGFSVNYFSKLDPILWSPNTLLINTSVTRHLDSRNRIWARTQGC